MHSDSIRRWVVSVPVIAGAGLFSASTTAAAQGAVNVTVSASIVPTASLRSTPIDFGTLVVGQSLRLPASGGNGTPGQIILDSNADQVTVTMPREMVLNFGGARITAQLECSAATTASGNAVAFDCSVGQTFRNSGTNDTRHVIFVGGSIDASETTDKTAGPFVGTITVTAAYSAS